MKTIGSLFAGIGGFDLGFERAGFKTTWACEIDQKAQAVLRLRFPDAKLHDDVNLVGSHNLEPVDIVTFGSPCQDLSVAGKRAGLAGERSGLFHEAVRIIRELRAAHGKPDFAIWENVPGAFSSNGGRDFAAVIDALVNIRARDVAWRVLDSRFFGVAQRRRRVFLVADFGGERAEQVLALAEGVRGYSQESSQARQKSAPSVASSTRESGPFWRGSDQVNAETLNNLAGTLNRNAGQSGGILFDGVKVTHCSDVTGTLAAADGPKGVSDQYAHEGKLIALTMQTTASPLDASYGKGPGNRAGTEREFVAVAFNWQEGPGGDLGMKDADSGGSPPLRVSQTLAVADTSVVRRLTPTECCRLQGFPDDWNSEGIDAKGKRFSMADAPRYRQLGNAVTVNVANWIANNIVKVYAAHHAEP